MELNEHFFSNASLGDLCVVESVVKSSLSPEQMDELRAIAKENSDTLDRMMLLVTSKLFVDVNSYEIPSEASSK